MKCSNCGTDMSETYKTTLIANDEKEEGIEYTCPSCGKEEYIFIKTV